MHGNHAHFAEHFFAGLVFFVFDESVTNKIYHLRRKTPQTFCDTYMVAD